MEKLIDFVNLITAGKESAETIPTGIYLGSTDDEPIDCRCHCECNCRCDCKCDCVTPGKHW